MRNLTEKLWDDLKEIASKPEMKGLFFNLKECNQPNSSCNRRRKWRILGARYITVIQKSSQKWFNPCTSIIAITKGDVHIFEVVLNNSACILVEYIGPKGLELSKNAPTFSVYDKGPGSASPQKICQLTTFKDLDSILLHNNVNSAYWTLRDIKVPKEQSI